MRRKIPRPIRVYISTLGCPKNLVDSEATVTILCRSGCVVTEDPREADLMLVGACSFLEAAETYSAADSPLPASITGESHTTDCAVQCQSFRSSTRPTRSMGMSARTIISRGLEIHALPMERSQTNRSWAVDNRLTLDGSGLARTLTTTTTTD